MLGGVYRGQAPGEREGQVSFSQSSSQAWSEAQGEREEEVLTEKLPLRGAGLSEKRLTSHTVWGAQ